MKLIVYIVCHNDESRDIAYKEYGQYDWAKVIIIPTTKYRENIMYTKILLDLYDEWKDADYVGTLSYKARTKTTIPENLQDFINKAKQNNADLIYFYNYSECKLDIHTQAVRAHGDVFRQIWKMTLNEMGFDDKTIFDKNIIKLYSNYWIATSKLLFDYCSFIEKVSYIFENNTKLKTLLDIDPGYAKPSQFYIESTGKSFLEFHGFIIERLICFYVFYYKYSITYFNDLL